MIYNRFKYSKVNITVGIKRKEIESLYIKVKVNLLLYIIIISITFLSILSGGLGSKKIHII